MMRQTIRTRIGILSRATMVGALLVAGLIVVASRLPVDRASVSQVPTPPLPISPIHSQELPAADATRRVVVESPYPTAPPEQPATVVPVPPAATQVIPTSEPVPDVSRRIGIVAGHWGYDSGAICDDGLQEVDITVDIARRVAEQLRLLGYEVDILKEHDPDKPEPPLQNYLAAAFLSLHVDSCLPGTTGFKVSRWRFSSMAQMEDRLVQCLDEEYSAATGLPRHDSSITIDMWNYYAFREIAEPTPGAIIEMGFMTDDRRLLVEQPDLAAQGIVNGLLCFLTRQ